MMKLPSLGKYLCIFGVFEGINDSMKPLKQVDIFKINCLYIFEEFFLVKTNITEIVFS